MVILIFHSKDTIPDKKYLYKNCSHQKYRNYIIQGKLLPNYFFSELKY